MISYNVNKNTKYEIIIRQEKKTKKKMEIKPQQVSKT